MEKIQRFGVKLFAVYYLLKNKERYELEKENDRKMLKEKEEILSILGKNYKEYKNKDIMLYHLDTIKVDNEFFYIFYKNKIKKEVKKLRLEVKFPILTFLFLNK